MKCCLNPDCSHPQNHDTTKFCLECGTPLILLRNRYQPIKPLGSGGFGQTYLAEDLDKLHELCVIKQFAPQVVGTAAIAKATELFEEEAKRLQQLGDRPQIPTLFAYFEQDRRLYLVQQYIAGETLLQELASQGKFSELKIKELLVNLLEILQFIHQHRVIHRDIKPANIIRRTPPKLAALGEVTQQESPSPPRTTADLVLIDFGISKQSTGTSQTELGTSLGTVGYAPQEQIQMGKANAASDLYSLGATCFHLLTGVSPSRLWQAEGDRWVDNWQQHLPTPLSGKLTKVINKLLQFDPEQRYQSAAIALADLTGNRVSSNKHKVKIKEICLLGIIPIILLLITQSYGYFKYKLAPLNQLFIITFIQNTTRQQGEFLVSACTGEQPCDRWVSSLAMSQNSDFLANGDADTKIKIWDLKTKQLRRSFNGDNFPIEALAVTPDGRMVAGAAHNGKLKIWDVTAGQLKREMGGRNYPFNTLTFSPDGQTLVGANTDNAIEIWNWQTGKLVRTLKDHTDLINSVVISPDGQTLISGSADNSIKLWDFKTGELKTTLVGHSEGIKSLAITPDGKTLVSGSSDRTIKLWDLAAGEMRKTLVGHSGAIDSLAISADEKTLASGSSDNTIKLWNLETGAIETTLLGHNRTVSFLSVTSNGKTLVSGSQDGQIKMWHFSN
ncbi:WD40 repeat domain-containing serine/threonine-protein kinase [Merismopedia glauca]|uniref:Serine/threonine protein kinase n=1 Tax=Merismopedia glauca CCAP 1448/3 TaxID=1296344 RepID=A0A2T1C2F2_9CYAN|nr:WD40 repeat domain-containing serine/threonine-protein kinase [Merismopedia glauca]PSB02327.1 serine/threonine protein kinase [Merismopedia glauca CCAP 1448/3]